MKNFINPEGHQNRIGGSKATAILLKELMLPIGGASAVEGLRSTGLPRLFSYHKDVGPYKQPTSKQNTTLLMPTLKATLQNHNFIHIRTGISELLSCSSPLLSPAPPRLVCSCPVLSSPGRPSNSCSKVDLILFLNMNFLTATF